MAEGVRSGYLHEGLWARATLYRQKPDRTSFTRLLGQLLHGAVWVLQTTEHATAADPRERYVSWTAEDGSSLLPVFATAQALGALFQRQPEFAEVAKPLPLPMRDVLGIVLGQPAYSALVVESGGDAEVTIERRWLETVAMGEPNWDLAAALEQLDDGAARRERVIEVLRRPGQVWAQSMERIGPDTDPSRMPLRTLAAHEGFTALAVFSSLFEALLFDETVSRIPVPTPAVIDLALTATDGILLNPGEPTEFLALGRAELTAPPG